MCRIRLSLWLGIGIAVSLITISTQFVYLTAPAIANKHSQSYRRLNGNQSEKNLATALQVDTQFKYLDAQINEKCETAWKRVFTRLKNGDPENLIRFEFCRFLGVLESEANLLLPDLVLGIVPDLIDLENRRIVTFSFQQSGLDEPNSIQPRFGDLRNSDLSETARNHETINYRIVGLNYDISIPLNIGNRFHARRFLVLENKDSLVSFSDQAEGRLAFYKSDTAVPTWIANIKKSKSPQMNATGRGISYSVIMAESDVVCFLEINRFGFSVNTFRLNDGRCILHFSVPHGDLLLGELPQPSVQERPLNDADLND